jgi:uncharacterized protein
MHSGKVTLLYGPRQAGKTTLARQVITACGLRTLYINADQTKYQELFSEGDLFKMRGVVEGYEMLFIDEGQRIPNIGLTLKILHDEIPELKILVTGSSSFLLSGRVSESLAGRKRIFTLLPISEQELALAYNSFERNELLDLRMIYGSYPEVLTTVNIRDKEEYLRDITDSLIMKDILELENIRYPLKIKELLRLLGFQTGSQVSIHELCNKLGINRETTERYLYLLEQAFIIFKLPALSRNPRKEVTKSQKYYFYDNGIRNMVTEQLNPFPMRNDTGALWENFMVSERIKYLQFNRINANSYFWRSYSGAEIDYIEELQGELTAYEIKYKKGKLKAPATWQALYEGDFRFINRDNYSAFIL